MNSRRTEQAKKLRQNQTDAEKIIWKHLRRRNLAGARFRRQQPIGKYIVDFICFAKKLVVEIDGGQHGTETQRLKDAERDEWLRGKGYTVLRFPNYDVIKSTDSVLAAISKRLEES